MLYEHPTFLFRAPYQRALTAYAACLLQKFYECLRRARSRGYNNLRGMVVTRSRQHVVWYTQALRKAVESAPELQELLISEGQTTSSLIYGAYSGTVAVDSGELCGTAVPLEPANADHGIHYAQARELNPAGNITKYSQYPSNHQRSNPGGQRKQRLASAWGKALEFMDQPPDSNGQDSNGQDLERPGLLSKPPASCAPKNEAGSGPGSDSSSAAAVAIGVSSDPSDKHRPVPSVVGKKIASPSNNHMEDLDCDSDSSSSHNSDSIDVTAYHSSSDGTDASSASEDESNGNKLKKVSGAGDEPRRRGRKRSSHRSDSVLGSGVSSDCMDIDTESPDGQLAFGHSQGMQQLHSPGQGGSDDKDRPARVSKKARQAAPVRRGSNLSISSQQSPQPRSDGGGWIAGATPGSNFGSKAVHKPPESEARDPCCSAPIVHEGGMRRRPSRLGLSRLADPTEHNLSDPGLEPVPDFQPPAVGVDDVGASNASSRRVAVSEAELNGRGARPFESRLLVVCSKYETGYDDPRLGVMFIDRIMSGAFVGHQNDQSSGAAATRAVNCSVIFLVVNSYNFSIYGPCISILIGLISNMHYG